MHNDPKCDKKGIVCPKCGHLGHLSRHLNIVKNKDIDLFNVDENTKFWFLYAVVHSCYVENKAEGRNIWCYVSEDWVDRNGVYITVKLKRDDDLPDFVADRQQEFLDNQWKNIEVDPEQDHEQDEEDNDKPDWDNEDFKKWFSDGWDDPYNGGVHND